MVSIWRFVDWLPVVYDLAREWAIDQVGGEFQPIGHMSHSM
jgi:hypothetical protein